MGSRRESSPRVKGPRSALDEFLTGIGPTIGLIDGLNCGLLVTDGAGNNVYVNSRLARWMHSTPDELLGENRKWLLPEQVEAVESERALILAGDFRARLLVLRRMDGTTFPALLLPNRLGGGFAFLVIELGTVQTARRIGEIGQDDRVLATLQTMALQLRQLVDSGVSKEPPVDLRHPALRSISARELEVLDLLLQGERVATIAEQLFISDHTVRNHLKSMFRKTGTSSQADLVRWVRNLG